MFSEIFAGWKVNVNYSAHLLYIIYLGYSMKFKDVYIEGFQANLPPNEITTAEVEDLLQPAYERAGLSKGRLEMFTGIQSRRYWDLGTKPSDVSSQAGQQLIDKLGLDKKEIDLLIHASVCRDFIEPATSSVVHSKLKLSNHTLNFDISNACLGVMTAVGVAADMISSGRIRRALVVSGEVGYPLLCNTIKALNADEALTRKTFKPHFASLTIGSCATAVMVSHESVAKDGSHKLIAGSDFSYTEFNHLCQGDADAGMGAGAAPQMHTDSEELLVRGVEAAAHCWTQFKQDFNVASIDRVVTHQVGVAHRNLLFDTLDLNYDLDYMSFPYLGNCGSASLPATVALAEEKGLFKSGDQVALLGIGSGINCNMLGISW